MELLSFLFGGVAGILLSRLWQRRVVKQSKNKDKRWITERNIMHQWLIMKERNISLQTYFAKKGIQKIAVYGVGILGRHLIRDLRTLGIEPCYAMDSKAMAPYEGIEIKKICDNVTQVDAVIVCVSYDFENIKQALKGKGYQTVIDIESLIFDAYEAGVEIGLNDAERDVM